MGNSVSSKLINNEIEFYENPDKLHILNWNIQDPIIQNDSDLNSSRLQAGSSIPKDSINRYAWKYMQTGNEELEKIPMNHAKKKTSSTSEYLSLTENRELEIWICFGSVSLEKQKFSLEFSDLQLGAFLDFSNIQDKLYNIVTLPVPESLDRTVAMSHHFEVYLPSDGAPLYIYFVEGRKTLIAKGKLVYLWKKDLVENVAAQNSIYERRTREQQLVQHGKSSIILPNASIYQVNNKALINPEKPIITNSNVLAVSESGGDALKTFREKNLKFLIEKMNQTVRAPVRYCIANDGTPLAYRMYFPTASLESALIFVGQNSAQFDYLASKIAASSLTIVMIAEVRGYGYSGGERGASSDKESVWMDVRSFVRQLHGTFLSQFLFIPVFLAGHLHTAGLLLNYMSWKDKEPVEGIILISPQLGKEKAGDTWRKEIFDLAERAKFGKCPQTNFILSFLTRGRFKGGTQPALEFHYPDEAYLVDPMTVDKISTNVLSAVTPSDPKRQLETLPLPLLFIIGELDELFRPDVILKKYISLAKNPHNHCCNISGVGHNDVLVHDTTISTIKTWISNVTKSICEERRLLDKAPLARKSKIHFSSLGGDITNDPKPSISENSNTTITKDIPSIFSEIKYFYQKTLSQLDSLPSFYYMESFDSTLLAYQVFKPSDPETHLSGVLILWIECIYSCALAHLADDLKVIIYRFDMRGCGVSEGPRGIITNKEDLWYDVKHSVLLGKKNHPELVLFLGGHSLGAGLVLNYASWSEAETPHAYIFFSQAANPTKAVHKKLFSLEGLHSMIYFPSQFPIFSSLKLSNNESQSIENIQSKMNANRTTSFKLNKRILESNPLHILQFGEQFIKGCLAKNLLDQLLRINIPFGLWMGESDTFFNSNFIIRTVSRFNTAPLHVAEVVRNVGHASVLLQMKNVLTTWVNRVASSLNPYSTSCLESLTLDDFQKIELIGKGTFGFVWLVLHLPSQKYYAVKVLRKTLVLSHKLIDQVQREKHLLERANSPFIVPFVGAFQNPFNLYICMEFLVGGELYSLLKVYGKLPHDWVRFYTAEILIALEYLHGEGILYRDLKPENILLDALGHIRLIDFGLARPLSSSSYATTFCGSPFYMAPEMISDKCYGFEIDIWSFGVVLFELLTGQLPFSGSVPSEIYQKILLGKIEWPSQQQSIYGNHHAFSQSLDPDAKDLISKLLERRPQDRLGSIGLEKSILDSRTIDKNKPLTTASIESGSPMASQLNHKYNDSLNSSQNLCPSAFSLSPRESTTTSSLTVASPPSSQVHLYTTSSSSHHQVNNNSYIRAIMNHKFYKGIDWGLLRNRQMTPPFQPTIKSETDTSHFIKYHIMPEEDFDYPKLAPMSPPDYGDLFDGF